MPKYDNSKLKWFNTTTALRNIHTAELVIVVPEENENILASTSLYNNEQIRFRRHNYDINSSSDLNSTILQTANATITVTYNATEVLFFY